MNIRELAGKIRDRFSAGPSAGVPEVALFVAGMDGVIRPEEVEAFRALARDCPGYAESRAEAVFDRALRGAGYLAALAVPGVADEARRVEAFVEESIKLLPRDFAMGRLDEARYAVTLWTAMALSDGDLAGIELKALNALKERLAQRFETFKSASTSMVGSSNGDLTPLFQREIERQVKAFLASECLSEAQAMLKAL